MNIQQGKVEEPHPLVTWQEDSARSGIEDAMELVHQTAVDAGWYKNPHTGEPIERNVEGMLLLVHSEISEATEGFRKDLMDDHLPHRKMMEVELADAMIRIMDLAAYLKLDLAGAVLEKNQYNKTRKDHSLEERAKENGKRF